MAGRTQLIRAVLFSIQSYWTNHFLLPGNIHKKLQSLFTRFLWNGDNNKKGGAKVAWDHLCVPQSEGGLNLKNPKDWNKVQILHHLCRVVRCSKSIGVQWVWNTALKRNHFWTMEIPTDCSWIWKRILKLRPLARSFLIFKIGNGQGTSLWFDPWWNNTCLARKNSDLIIRQCGLNAQSTVNCLLSSGTWILPRPTQHLHHINPGLSTWLHEFVPPAFDLHKHDSVLWTNISLHKI